MRQTLRINRHMPLDTAHFLASIYIFHLSRACPKREKQAEARPAVCQDVMKKPV